MFVKKFDYLRAIFLLMVKIENFGACPKCESIFVLKDSICPVCIEILQMRKMVKEAPSIVFERR